MLTLDAVLLGGGIGKRFGGEGSSGSALPKQFRMLGGAPVFIHALRAFLSMDCFRQIVMAFPKDYKELAQDQIDAYIEPQSRTLLRVVDGGDRRQDSSHHALSALEEVTPLPTRVLIHDACRPFLPAPFLERIKLSLLDRSYGAWVPVVPVIDTLKRVENMQVIETVDRAHVHRVQTPQIFEYTAIRSLMEKSLQVPDNLFTDDASLCEYYGIPVGVFEGDVRNIKLTYGFELDTLRSFLEDENCVPVLDTTFTV